MQPLPKIPAILLLEDGTVYQGLGGGKVGTTTGEICFNTGMTGYQEIFTDPSYFGQILVATHEHIGNYGIKDEEIESETIKIAGLVCKNFSVSYSRKQASKSIEDYFLEQHKTAISGIDTRALVRRIRTSGAMNAIISSETTDIDFLKKELSKVPSMNGLELASIVSTKHSYEYGDVNAKIRIAAVDYGIKKNILRCFDERNCFVRIFPARTSFEEMQSFRPDGYFLSNGPGDPAPMNYAVKTVGQILDSDIPLFGICLGHQLLALASGVSTYKMHHGHRGINHPVKNIVTGRCEITSQNHGFEVNRKDIEQSKNVEITHVNLNDETIEGIRLKNKKAFSVQYHPESSPGPHDSRYLFDEFVSLIENGKQ